MTEYEYQSRTWERAGGTVDVPDDAVGVTTDYFGDMGVVKFLAPVEDD